MSFLLSPIQLLGGLWGRIAMLAVGVASIAATLLGIRWRIRKTAKEEMSSEIQERTLDRIKDAQDAADDARGIPDGDIRNKLRDKGYLRD